jgi:hypothetical protein
MKKIAIASLTFLMLFSSCAIFNKGGKTNSFTGKIKYDIKYEALNLPEQARSQLPDKSTLYIKGKKSSTEVITAMISRKTIKNAETMYSVNLIDAMGQKFAIEQSKEEILEANEEQDEVTLEFTDNTKTIAGYEAKEVIVTPEEGEPYSVFYTPEISGESFNFDSPVFKKIDGLPLEFKVDAEMFEMVMKASSVEETKIKDETFEIPEGYQKVTKEELQNMFGG